MFFDRMAKYFQKQSSNRYSVNGDVNDWVKVPFNEARYGRNDCGGIVCDTDLALHPRRDGRLGTSAARRRQEHRRRSTRYLGPFDVWDRYDGDGDGNFNEPDGFIDHFQIVHAGMASRPRGDPHRAPTRSGATAGTRPTSGGGPTGSPA